MKLKDKVALVTGSSRGVGKSIALAFAKEGAKVMINYTSNEKAANEVLETIQKMGGQAKVFKADVAKKAEAQALVQATVDAFGGL
ncbi:MAG: short-chain dehydrogenase, partial [Deltaproteobacteria bacterium]|nr:short-chain dehydrogenase [Deltaproteobacteria bacterium]